MNFLASKVHASKIFGSVFALMIFTIFAGTSRANVLSVTSPVTLTCNTATGPGAAASITVKPQTALTGTNTIVVSVGTVSTGLAVTAPSITTLAAAASSTAATSITYTVAAAPGCSGLTSGANAGLSVQFKAGSSADSSTTVSVTVTAAATVLSANNVTITCGVNGGTYTPGAPQTVSVTSTAAGGTPYTITTAGAPAWLSIGTPSSPIARTSPSSFTVSAVSPCNSLTAGNHVTYTLVLADTPSTTNQSIIVTLQVYASSPLTAAPSPASLSYVKNSGTAGYVDVAVTSGSVPSAFFGVNTATLPSWLTVNYTTGTVPKTIRFSSTSVCDSLAPGVYSATVYLQVTGYGDLPLPITLQITNTASKLTVSGGTTQNISWAVGQALPTPFLTLVSTDAPIPYSIVTAGSLAPSISSNLLNGLAYNFGTPIPVTFNPLVFAAATPGTVLTGTVNITWGKPAATIVVTFNVTVQSPGATLISVAPASLPTAAAGQTFTVTLSGTGFIPSTNSAIATKVGVVISNAVVTDTNFAVSVLNSSNMVLTITVPTITDTNLPFAPSGTGGTVVIGVCNPVGGTCSTPTGTASLSIGSNPIVQAVTSGSSFIQVTAPAQPNVAPYDMLSIFGTAFCSSGGTGCSSTQLLYGTLDPITLSYQTTVSPDAAGATQRLLSVTFQTTANPPVVIASAPILFASNSQINVLAPSALATYITTAPATTVSIVVNFGYGSGPTIKSSLPFPVTVVATDPGVFTVSSDGLGDGAILSANYAGVSNTNPGGMRSGSSDSDVVLIYMSGLGVPDSSATDTSGGGQAWSADCVSIASFLSLEPGSLVTADGAIIQSSLIDPSRKPPCITSSGTDVPTVTIGGVSATVQYAGWVADSVAGLYQLNVLLPQNSGNFTTSTGATIVGGLTSAVQLPVVVTSNSVNSQAGVNMWVAPRLNVTGLSGTGLTGTVGVVWPTSNSGGNSNTVTATEGTSPYSYALTSGVLPSGLVLDASAGTITGTPAASTAGSYVLTVTATDSAHIPVTGSVTFTLTVAGGLFMTATGSGTATYNAGGSSTLQTIHAAGGTYPYTYAITAPGSLPAGLTISSTTGVITAAAGTPAGVWNLTVQATDSTTGTPLTGQIIFTVTINLKMTYLPNPATVSGTSGGTVTFTATGNTGTLVYALDTTTAAIPGVTFNTGTGVLTVASSSATASNASAVVTVTDSVTKPAGATGFGTATVTFAFTIN